MKAVRAYLRRCKVVCIRLDHAHRKSTRSICVFKGAEMSRQSQRSARVVRAGSNEAQQAKNKRRPSSKPTASSTHPSCCLARVQSRVPSRHVAGSSSPLAERRILILHQEAGCRGLSGGHAPTKMHAKSEIHLGPSFSCVLSMCQSELTRVKSESPIWRL